MLSTRTVGAIRRYASRLSNVDNDRSKPSHEREPLVIREIYIAQVTQTDFRRNERGELGTRTATLHADGVKILRDGWVYLDIPTAVTDRRRSKAWRQARKT